MLNCTSNTKSLSLPRILLLWGLVMVPLAG